jgi:N utilization substance protein B
MGDRRIGRELALQALYKLDMLGEAGAAPGALGAFWEHCLPEGVERGGESEQLARALVEGVERNRARIDELIAGAAEHWKLPRLSRVDLNLLRIATYELLERREIPTPVAINEAIEIARRFGSEDSAAFVNGVLDHIAGVLGVRAREVREP